MEPDDSDIEACILLVIRGQLFREQLLPAVPFLGIGRDGIGLSKGHSVLRLLEEARIDAGRRGEEIPFDAFDSGRLQHVRVDEDIVPAEPRMLRADVANAAHVRRQLVDILDASNHALAGVRDPEVGDDKLVRRAWLKLRVLDVGSSNPETLLLQSAHEVVSDESAGPRDQNLPTLGRHFGARGWHPVTSEPARRTSKLRFEREGGGNHAIEEPRGVVQTVRARESAHFPPNMKWIEQP